ncbi:MerR family transcriptional regulator [Mycobacterium sp. ITM-2016-00318]|uniref:MerR family transcriptional regulator n=1 Tax=Mycobacterium sp. ITM-2016-00318 TaxID=2099693 RepID=UPI001E4AA79D|nr:MerR family transcriptional regulator [Mycobacterium sp. ITM-2016-00318]WNG91355.1 MerR family transcriptional regulator [Mycobacterium sp. ITM-2016-00318]
MSACEVAVPGDDWCAGLAEYRLDDLARISGVSSRNIRAYRERGLLDPPRRQGRSAFYDDYHLSQLKTINQLLRKGFNSAHIAEFFARMREGHDLAAILGVQQAILGGGGEDGRPAAAALDLDPDCDEAQRLLSYGLAELVEDSMSLTHPAMAEIVTRSADQLSYVRMILRVVESAGGTIDELSAVLVAALEDAIAARYGAGYVPNPEELDDVAGLIDDYRDLGIAIVTHLLDQGLQRHMVSAVSNYATAIVARGQWKPADS